MEKRIFLAILISLGLLWGWAALAPKLFPELVKKPLVAQDVADTISFLLGDGAKNYTGAVFDLNNGFHL